MFNEVKGSGVLVISGQSLRDAYKNIEGAVPEQYFAYLESIDEAIAGLNPAAVIIMGNITECIQEDMRYRDFFVYFCRFIKSFGRHCPVYAMKGDPQTPGYTDFEFLSEFGYILTTRACDGYFDYYTGDEAESPEARFRLIDMGDEIVNDECSYPVFQLAYDSFKNGAIASLYKDHQWFEVTLQFKPQSYYGKYSIIQRGDVTKQIDTIPDVSLEVRKNALKYLNRMFNK